MHRKGSFLIFSFIAVFLCFPVFISAEAIASDSESFSNLVNPPADGIYKRDDIVIKFIPPSGWKISKNSFNEQIGLISFTPTNPLEMTNITVMVTPSSIPQAQWDVETLKKTMELNKNIESVEIIMFAGEKALSSVAAMSGVKTKQIQFCKGKNMIGLTFIAEEKNFDKIIPVIEKSLESFEIISPASQIESVTK